MENTFGKILLWASLSLAAFTGLATPASLARADDAAAATKPPVQAPIAPGSASAVLADFYAHLVAVMKDGQALGFKGRYDKLKPAIEAAYDLPLMTRLAIGPDWSTTSPDQQKKLISDFSDFSIATYANRFGTYDDQSFEVIDEKSAPATVGAALGGVIVETRLVPKDDAPVTLDYMLHKDDQGKWKIIDVFVNGTISELATRRSEFGTVMRNDGIEALMSLLAKKTSDLGNS